jgi:hypothetical protein
LFFELSVMSAGSKVWYSEEVGDRETEKLYGLGVLCAVRI